MADAQARTSLKQEEINKLRDYLMQAVHRELEHNPAALQSNGDMINDVLEKAYERTRLQLSPTLREQVFHDVTDNLMGYGPIQPLLDDPEVTEVMVNAYNSVYIERNGRLEKTGVQFDDDAHVLRVIERIVLPLGRRIDADSPAVDARLTDGSRVNAIVPPVALDGPSLTIRKFSKERLGIQDLINFGSLTEPMAEFLEACVKAHLNIVISGGTGSGKTTLLNILSGFIPKRSGLSPLKMPRNFSYNKIMLSVSRPKPPI